MLEFLLVGWVVVAGLALGAWLVEGPLLANLRSRWQERQRRDELMAEQIRRVLSR